MRALGGFFGVLLSLLVPATAAAQFFTEAGEEPRHEIVIGAGVYDPLDERTTAAFEVEYRPPLRLMNLVRPLGGVMINADGGGMAYAGFGLEFSLTDTVAVMPYTSVGGYWQGDSKSLGSAFQFRSGLELGYFMGNGHRIALSMLHISNANTAERNPGTEVISVRYGWAF